MLERGVFTADDVEQLQFALAELTGGQGLSGPWIASDPGTGFIAERDLHRRSAAWAKAVTLLTKKACAFYDADAQVAEVLAICKPPEKGQAFPPHQDGAYYGPEHGRYVIATVYLDPVTADNGSIRFAPKTHDALIPHKPQDGGKKSLRELYRVDDMVEPQGQPGDVVWSHLWTVHGSKLNTSAQARRSVRIGFTFA